ncbi:type I polyketide synthase [Burkholderia multivorans]|uniref:type I polyketide synthase n=1 Tax=Burkholderia multivorans TaxID=87883 RepID=UPI0015E3322B|nr:type I polyketide synthase [Burkholderia multivorans]MBU9401231.1 SDR family NAD(P)-dependent oxidoreductase [Burkholderia multivorans]
MKGKIAIIGAACRFPGGVTNLDEFWRLLRDERDAVTEIPLDRFGTDFYQHPSKREPGKSYTFAAGVLDDIAGFDAAFFGISPREAAQMDPQQRLLLELAWETFEDAGVRPADMRGSNCGVFVGAASMDYGNRNMDDLNVIDPYSATGNTLSIASNRVSYLFDLRGPSMSVDTACSSSLVALHQAIQALQSGEADMALAGGVNLLLHPFGFVSFSKASMLSPRGRCRAFDATGDGYVRSEGGAFVLLKPLDQALLDGDTIHAVIAGSGVNSVGHSPGGISVPGAAAQASLLRSVYARAGIDPQSVAYLEAHGTGTAVGDPIEARALIDVISGERSADRPLLIGSVKTNIGHLETASGMAGLLKAVLCLKYRAVPRSLHFDSPNPAIDFAAGRLRVADRYTPLDAGDAPLTIGVNSFGFGGTNAHVVLTEASVRAPTDKEASQTAGQPDEMLPPLVLTARSANALSVLASRYLAMLDNGGEWRALAAATARRRQWLEHRAIVAPADEAEGRASLASLAQPCPDGLPPCVVTGHAPADAPRTALVFSGNGCQWVGMGSELYAENVVFRAALDEVDALWCADGSASLVDVLRGAPGGVWLNGANAEWLAATENGQPLLFAIQVGLMRVIDARGMRYDAAIGHSVGEIAAAWITGALSLADAVHVIKVRSRAQAMTRGSGRMAAVGIGEAAARELIARHGLAQCVEIAGMNSPDAVTLAGELQGLQTLEAALRGSGKFFQMLDLDYAFHSSHMDRIEPIVLAELAGLRPRAGNGTFVSTVTGGALAGSELDARYWWRNIREPVRFGEGIAHLIEQGVRLFVEVSPHSILRTYVKQALTAAGANGISLPTLKRDRGSAATLQHGILAAVAHGASVDPDRFAPGSSRVALPTYPWQRDRYWLMPTIEGYGLVNRRREHPLLGYRLHEYAFAWENQLDPAKVPMLADHIVDGGIAFPGAGYVEMALAAARTFFDTLDAALENVEIRTPVVFQPQQAKVFRLVIEPRTASFTIMTRDRMSDGAWTLNVTGRMLESGSALGAESAVPLDMLERLVALPATDGDTLYENTAAIGLAYGPAFRWVRKLRVAVDDDAVLADVAAPAVCADARELSAYLLHPALLDSGFHPLFGLLAAHASSGDQLAYVPVQIGRVDYLRGDTIARVLARIVRRSPHSIVAHFEFLDAHGAIVARLGASRFRRVDLVGRRQNAPARFVYRLEEAPLPGDVDASSLPAPGTLLAQAVARLDAGRHDARRTQHLTEVLPLLDVLASLYALRAFDALGAFAGTWEPQPECADLATRLADMLVEDGLAHRDGGRLVRDDAACAALPPLEELWRCLLAESPGHVAELTLLAHCGAALPDVLSGAKDGACVLSPTGHSLVEQLLAASPTWQHVHALLAACVEQAVAVWQPARRLRVLELGAMGGDVLQTLGLHLAAARCDHTIAATAGQLAAFDADPESMVRTVALQPGEGLSLPVDHAGAYDLIVANRTLSGRRDIADVLNSMRSWLAPGGLLLLTESRRSRFSDIVVGSQNPLTNADTSALLAPSELDSELERAGYVDIARHVEQSLDLEGTPTFVIARNPMRSVATQATQRGGNASELDTRARNEQWLVMHEPDAVGSFGARVADGLVHAGYRADTVDITHSTDAIASLPVGQSAHIVFCAPEAPLTETATGHQLMTAQRNGAIALAALVRTLGARSDSAMRLTVITRGGTPFAGAPTARPEQATLWGLGRVLANEHPELACRMIDVGSDTDETFDALIRELTGVAEEEEVVLTPRGRSVPRMLTAAQAAARGDAAIARAAVLAFDAPGSLRNLEWFALAERPLGANEVEIEPVATGLNFRDVMYAMGLLSDEAVETGFAGASIGMELSGRVVRVGTDVTEFAPGDAVLGFAPASFATRVRTRTQAIARKPERLSFEEAATVPTTFFTAYYALVELARLRRGDRVLVHGGAGGVGIAAIQLARHFGAEVFATAGSDEKREFVRLLGADHVFDSRSLAFSDQIRAMTDGQGVDVVLNSLAGEAMVRSIDTLRPFGRFLELGKRDFYENSHIGLRPFRNNISYFGIDADQLMGARPELTARLFGEVMALFTAGVLHPLPYRAFPAERAEDAFRYMQQARQIGKVLVTYPFGTPAPTRGVAAANCVVLDSHAAYLVVGGTGGLGFASARWMIERGARRLTLASRSGELAIAARGEVEHWRETLGVTVDVVSCDVTDAVAVDAMVDAIVRSGIPLKGVLHSAMSIDDGLIRNLDDARMASVLAPKVAGAWNLHRATRGCPLDLFVVYSSATTYLGNPGQANYVAANTFLEALVEHRRAAGLPGTFMAWGPLEDVGFLARHAETREALQSRIGGASITSREAMVALERTLAEGEAGEAVVRLDWHAVSRGMPAAKARRYSLLQSHAKGADACDGGTQLRDEILVLPRDEAIARVAATLQSQIARILHMMPDRIALDKSVLDMGMDSLMGMELGLAVEEAFEVKLSVMAIAEGASVMTLAGRIVDAIGASVVNGGEPVGDSVKETIEALAAKHAIDVEVRAFLGAERTPAAGHTSTALEIAR